MDRLNALLEKQYKRYRNRMNYMAWYFGWDLKYLPPQLIRPWGRMHGKIR